MTFAKKDGFRVTVGTKGYNRRSARVCNSSCLKGSSTRTLGLHMWKNGEGRTRSIGVVHAFVEASA